MAKYKKPIGENLLSTSSDLTAGMSDRVKKYQQTLDEILQANDVACSFMDVTLTLHLISIMSSSFCSMSA